MSAEGNRLNADLLRQLECPICRRTCFPPIRMCRSSHILCNTCFKRFPTCTICQQPMTMKRNFLAENLCSKVKVMCTNAKKGCSETMYLSELTTHVQSCQLRTFDCMACYTNMSSNMKCNWKGILPELRPHCQREHPTQLYVSSFPVKFEQTSVFLLNSFPQKYSQLICAEGQYFWFKQVYYPTIKELWFGVLFVGAEESASCFHYNLVMGHSESCTLSFNSDTVHVCVSETQGHVCKLSEYFLNILSRNGVLLFTLYLDKKHA